MAGPGGRRSGAGRKPGSKNKTTIAREVVAEVIDAPDPQKIEAAVHARGHRLLLELERIAFDPDQPIAARIVAAKAALPFLLPTQARHTGRISITSEEFAERLNRGREAVRASPDSFA